MNTIPVYLRLYEESKLRNKRQTDKEREIDEQISIMANSLSKKRNIVNYDKINQLYENKEKNKINFKTKTKVENEEGITFKPELNLNNKYIERICSNFYERNKKNKKNRIFEKYDKFEAEEKKIEKKYTEDERKEIVKNIVKRLYNDPIAQTVLNSKSEYKKIKWE